MSRARPRERAWRLAIAVAGLVVAADQAAKGLVEAELFPGETVDALGPLQITLTHNRGIAFGLASGGGDALIAMSAAALAFVGAIFARNPARPGMWLAIGLLVGGALGNLADRVRAGAVTDYLDLTAWPAFNLADAAITAGVALLAVSYLRHPR